MTDAPHYMGGCHCGRVRFRVRAELARATYCNCSICSKKGFIHLIVEPSEFELLAGAEALVSYRFNTGVAEHKFCGQCGIHPFYTPRSDPIRWTSTCAVWTTSILVSSNFRRSTANTGNRRSRPLPGVRSSRLKRLSVA